MATHKAYLYTGPGAPLKQTDMETPKPSTGQLLMSVLATSILHYVEKGLLEGGNLASGPRPIVPGTGAVGRILEVGSPNSTSLEKGQLVIFNPSIKARDDTSGHTSIIHGWFPGTTAASMKIMEGEFRHGAWAEKMLIPVECATVIDEEQILNRLGYKVSQLCWVNSILIPFSGLNDSNLRAGETVIVAPSTAVFGGCAVFVALAMGAGRVVALGRNEEALANVKKYDSGDRIRTVRLSGDVATDSAAIRAATPTGKGADFYLDLSPSQAKNSTHFKACFLSLKAGGRAVFMGGIREEIEINYGLMMLKGLSIKGQFMSSPRHTERVLDLIGSGLLDLHRLGVREFEFEKLDEALEAAKGFDRLENVAVLTPVKE